MVTIADRADAMRRSMIRDMMEKAEGETDLVRLEVGEPDFTTPGHIIEAAYRAALDGDTHYTSDAGMIELREEIARKMQREDGVDVDPETGIVVCAGANEAIHLALLAVVNPGDEILIPTPAWPNYATHAAAVGATPRFVGLSAEDGFALDVDRIVDALRADTAAVLLTTPNNPTGQVYDPKGVRAIADAAGARDAVVIADEVYESLTFGGESRSVASYVADPDSVLVVNSFSKRYAMTGWRVGWLAGHPDVMQTARTFHQGTSSCASSVSQRAALAGLTGPQEPIRAMNRAFAERRDYVCDRFDAMPNVTCHEPAGGFYAFPNVASLPGQSLDIADTLLTEYGVVTVPGTGFGDAGENHLRISFATGLSELEKGLDRIESFAERAHPEGED